MNDNRPGEMNADQNTIRCFIGVAAADMALDDALEARIAQWQHRAEMQDVRWTPRDFLHLTLVFMGAQPRQTLTSLIALLDDALARCTTFPISLTHCSGFPDAKSRILAAIPESTPPLLALQQVVAQAVASAGIAVDTRQYLPHITMGRLGRHQYIPDFVEPMLASGQVRAVSLYRSDAVASGSHYTVIARWLLRDSSACAK